MEFITQIELSKTDKKEILNLWNDEYPEKLNYQTLSEFEKYLGNLTEQSHILMKSENEKWFAILLDSKFHGKGFGTKLLNLGKEKETELNGWVIDKQDCKRKNGELYKSPLDFYIKNRFQKLDNESLELEKIAAVKIKWKKHCLF